MAMTKEEVKNAFREAMARDYADVPSKDSIDYHFSPEFYEKMDKLIADYKRGVYR